MKIHGIEYVTENAAMKILGTKSKYFLSRIVKYQYISVMKIGEKLYINKASLINFKKTIDKYKNEEEKET